MGCTCEKQEVGYGINGVKGHIVTKECDECRVKREASNVIAEEQRKVREAEQAKNELIQAKMREMAEKELKKEGKL